MTRVYLEKPICWAIEIATFVDDDAYMAALPALEAWAKSLDDRYEITESEEYEA